MGCSLFFLGGTFFSETAQSDVVVTGVKSVLVEESVHKSNIIPLR